MIQSISFCKDTPPTSKLFATPKRKQTVINSKELKPQERLSQSYLMMFPENDEPSMKAISIPAKLKYKMQTLVKILQVQGKVTFVPNKVANF